MEPFSFESRAHRRRSRSVGNMDHLQMEESRTKRESGERVVKARPAPHFGVPILPPKPATRVTEVQPFSFEQRDIRMMERKHEKIEKFLEDERKAREFKANPMPNLNKPVGLPIKEVLLPTQPEPFNLEVSKLKFTIKVNVLKIFLSIN